MHCRIDEVITYNIGSRKKVSSMFSSFKSTLFLMNVQILNVFFVNGLNFECGFLFIRYKEFLNYFPNWTLKLYAYPIVDRLGKKKRQHFQKSLFREKKINPFNVHPFSCKRKLLKTSCKIQISRGVRTKNSSNHLWIKIDFRKLVLDNARIIQEQWSWLKDHIN